MAALDFTEDIYQATSSVQNMTENQERNEEVPGKRKHSSLEPGTTAPATGLRHSRSPLASSYLVGLR